MFTSDAVAALFVVHTQFLFPLSSSYRLRARILCIKKIKREREKKANAYMNKNEHIVLFYRSPHKTGTMMH